MGNMKSYTKLRLEVTVYVILIYFKWLIDIG